MHLLLMRWHLTGPVSTHQSARRQWRGDLRQAMGALRLMAPKPEGGLAPATMARARLPWPDCPSAGLPCASLRRLGPACLPGAAGGGALRDANARWL